MYKIPDQNEAKEALPGWMLLAVPDSTARSDRVLNLKEGDLVELIDDGTELGDGWLLGKHVATGKIGRFPRACTMLVPKGASTAPTQFWLENDLFLNVSETPHQPSRPRSDSPQCGICLDELVNAYALPCGDVFCEKCISRWLQDSLTCPLDRQPVPAEVKDDIDYNSTAPSLDSSTTRNPVSTSPPLHFVTLANGDRVNISWPLERPNGPPYHSVINSTNQPESFWSQLRQLGRLTQESRRPRLQPGHIAAH